MANQKTLIAIVGPTASGKTAVGIELAQAFHTVILSADSRQFYREMSIGTAKPTAQELAQAPHYFVDTLSINDTYTVSDYEQEALAVLDNVFQTKDTVIMVGGSGLFVRAVCEGFDELPTIEPGVRERLNEELHENGISYLQAKLKEVDPVYYNEVDINNPQRVIRALEVFESSGQPFSSFRKAIKKPRPFTVLEVGIELPREVLYERINKRVDNMMELGLLDEVKTLLPYRKLNALNTVGYAELFDYLDGNTSLETAVSMIKQNTRRFAKRQMTWFNKEKDVNWIPAGEILDFVKTK